MGETEVDDELQALIRHAMALHEDGKVDDDERAKLLNKCRFLIDHFRAYEQRDEGAVVEREDSTYVPPPDDDFGFEGDPSFAEEA